ncbi:hypothetical protein BD410DRAFT_831489 [Rickenella mellea]|uniref:Uncharacterized protein n=1 Tax=Rickenella mellea TaxID=50990 RepID=A0A4Y7PPW9_9AGAM|nr:hypothetical protein BD410DRAFT_831489 [Rickenella mellea]
MLMDDNSFIFLSRWDRLIQPARAITHFVAELFRQGCLLVLPMLYFKSVFKLFASPRGGRKIPPAEFPKAWADFIKTCVSHWQTFNIVTVLVLQFVFVHRMAVLTLLQISDAAQNAPTRFFALVSLLSALWCIIYSCMFIMRFGNMNHGNQAHRWAKESEVTSKNIFWNVWVMFALPAVWLAWSIIFFCIAILTFICTTGKNTDTPSNLPGTEKGAWGIRLPLLGFFSLGVLYFLLIIRTFGAFSDDDLYDLPKSWKRVEFVVDLASAPFPRRGERDNDSPV